MKSNQIEAIFELGDVDGDGELDMEEFVGAIPNESKLLCLLNDPIFSALMCPKDDEKNENGDEKNDKSKGVSVHKCQCRNNPDRLKLQDKVKTARQALFCLLFFPLLFFVFNLFYWILFLNYSKHLNADAGVKSLNPNLISDRPTQCTC